MSEEIETALEKRLGRCHARQRLGIEQASEPRVFGGGINFFHPENWYSGYALMRYCLKLSGLFWMGQKNTFDFRLVQNEFHLSHLPSVFDGLRILHLSDLHVDMNFDVTRKLCSEIAELEYDVCVLTGDYRASTSGPIDEAVEGMALIAQAVKEPVYAVLGNHDSVRMVPEIEAMGINMLLNESVEIDRAGEAIHLAGVDDAHYFRVDNIEKASEAFGSNDVSILLSHTPEIYKQAAHAEFDVMLCGHTHGGQICLPGRIPITLDSKCPRRLGAGNWRYHRMLGYTSVGAGTSIVNVRLNCPPEITIHTLRKKSD